ncbi:MAG: hypothetical protein Kow0019_03260 [Methanobacteriaceae archaeon]
MLAIPSSVGVMDSVNTQENVKIELDNKEIQQASAATYQKVRYKKWYRSNGRWRYYWATRYVRTSNTKVSAARTSTTTFRNSNYRPVRYKKWYRFNGRWRYYWATRYVRTTNTSVRASSTTSSTSNNYSTGSGSTNGLTSTANYINRNYNHRYGASTNAAGVRRTGYGDCWGLADLAAQKLKNYGYRVRVVQGPSRESPRHRWVQYQANGKWNTFESTMITKKYGSRHYSFAIASVRSVVRYY